MKTKLLVTLSAATMLVSCTMAPHYERPEAPVPAAWLSHEAAGEVAVVNIHWREVFADATLQGLIQTALENNKDLEVATYNIEAARAAYRIQRADLLPSLEGQASGTKQRTPPARNGTNASETSSTYTAQLAGTAYEVDLFGRVRSLNNAAKEDFMATIFARDVVRISLVAEVANAYLTWLANHELLALSNETLAAQEKSYTLITQSEEKGAASKLDVAQVRQAVENARVSQARFARQSAQSKNALALLLGTPDAYTLLETPAKLAAVNVKKKLPSGVPSSVLVNRPDVKQAEHTLKRYNANIGAARAAFFPRITLTGGLGFASQDLDNLFSDGASGAWSFTPSITLPIFQGGRNFANLGATKARKEAARATYEKTLQVAFKEVADELAASETLGQQLAAQQALVDASQKAYDLSYARYKQGVDSFLNVLDAQRTLFAAQQSAIELEKAAYSNVVNLYKVLGGGAQ